MYIRYTSKGFSFIINIVIEAILTLSSKTKFNVICYVSHIINCFP